MTDTTALRFRKRLLAGDGAPVLGTFIKTPSPHASEIIGSLGYDFVLIDAEHAPFDRTAIERTLLGARAVGVAALVRVAETNAPLILAALDDGAAGIVAPHVDSVEKARELVAACRYANGRGFSNSPRAGGYGARSMWQHVDTADREVTVIAMIEDPAAIMRVDEIVNVDGIDAIFIGRGDLAVAMNDRSAGAIDVREATAKAIDAARRARKAIFLLPASPEEAAEYHRLGVSGFVVSSDQGFLRNAASQTLQAFSAACRSVDQ